MYGREQTHFVTRLNVGIERAAMHLLGSVSPDGKLIGGCEARALETALALHIFQRMDREDARTHDLLVYCRRYLTTTAWQMKSRAAYLDATVSEILCTRAIGRSLSRSHLDTLTTILAGFDHSTSWRKRLLVHTLLAEFDLVPPPEPLLAPDAGRENQLWVRVLLTAMRILQACMLGRADVIGDAEVMFLIDAQSPDGSWEQHVLVTLVALLALARMKRPSGTAIDRGLAFVRRQIRPDGGVPFISNQDIWNTALGGLILQEAGAPRADLVRMADSLVAHQLQDGGFPYAEGVSQSDADDTAIALSFLTQLDSPAHRAAADRAEQNLLRLQNEDGGFPTFVRGAPSDAEITAKAIKALSGRAGIPTEPIERAWSWLSRNQLEDGGFRPEWKLCSTYPALHVLTADDVGPRSAAVKRRCVSFLRNRQRHDGGWSAHPDDGMPHVLATAYALGGLSMIAGAIAPNRARDGVELLLDAQSPSGCFHAPGDSLGPRPFVYDVPVLATVYALWALCRVRKRFDWVLLPDESRDRDAVLTDVHREAHLP